MYRTLSWRDRPHPTTEQSAKLRERVRKILGKLGRLVDGKLLICNLSPFIRKVLHAKRLLSPSQQTGNVAFEAVETLEDAVNLLNAAAEAEDQ